MRRSSYIRILTAPVVSIALVGTGTSTAQADSDPIEDVAGLIEAVAPPQGDVLTGTTEDAGHVVETNGTEIVAPNDSDDPITMTSTDPALPSAQVAVSLPAEASVQAPEVAQDGTIVYPSAESGGVDVAVQLMDEGSTRIQTIIPDADAPTQYTYDIQIGDGGTVQILPDGGALFLDADGEFAGGAAAPWAMDADANPVPTWYTTDGTNLVQHVDTSKAATFPVVADPFLGQRLIGQVSLASRDKRGWTVVVSPTWWGRLHGGTSPAQNALYKEYDSHVAAQHRTTQLHWQLYCHGQFAPFKDKWNLDTWVRRANYTDSVRHNCN